MQLNEIHNPHEHATVSLKVILLVFAVVLVGVLGYLVWDYNSAPDTTDYSSTTIKKTDSSSTEETDETADWKTFTSAIVDLKFKYPATSSYSETDPLKARVSEGLVVTGHQLFVSDKSKAYPDFYVTSSDFATEDTVPHDIITGTLSSKTSFTVKIFSPEVSPIITEVGSGMYKVTGYGNIECSPFVRTILFVRPPVGSGLKYINFYLGINNSDFSSVELDDTCTPKTSAITKRMNDLDADTSVKAVLAKAISISNTFTTK